MFTGKIIEFLWKESESICEPVHKNMLILWLSNAYQQVVSHKYEGCSVSPIMKRDGVQLRVLLLKTVCIV